MEILQTIHVSGKTLTYVSQQLIGDTDTLTIGFTFDADDTVWGDLKKSVVLYRDGLKYHLELDEENKVVVPRCVNQAKAFMVSLRGDMYGLTTNTITIKVEKTLNLEDAVTEYDEKDFISVMFEKLRVFDSTKIDTVEYIDNNLSFYANGELLFNFEITGGGGASYVLPTMSSTVKGGAKAGNNLVVVGETLNVTGVLLSETDPTVPDWAKNATKPIYNKAEVGLGNVDNTSDANKPVSTAQLAALNLKINSSLMAVPNGVATLDSSGFVPSSQLPSYVDDVLDGYLFEGAFYSDVAHTILISAMGGKIYLELTTNKAYRWSGSLYVVIPDSLALGEITGTAYDGLKGKTVTDALAAHLISNTAHAIATTSTNGFMSAASVTKLNGIATNANNYSLTNALLSDVLVAATEETVFAEDDTVSFTDTSATNATKKISFANLKLAFKAFFDTLYTKVITGVDIADAATLSVTLQPNTPARIATLTTCTSLTINLTAGNWWDEYRVIFKTGATAPSITLPASIEWADGTPPTFAANKKYEISVVDNFWRV